MRNKADIIRKLTDGLHCKACDAQISEHAYDTELCNKCMEIVWDITTDIDQPDDFIISIEQIDEEHW